MTREGRTKKFQLGTEGAPAIRQLLNDSGEEPLSTATLVEVCAEKVSDLARRMDVEWYPGWSKPIQPGV